MTEVFGMELYIGVYGAEPYDLDDYDLPGAIATEARTVADDAGSDLLAEGTDEERDELAARIVREASAALRQMGDTYRDPSGVVWSLGG